MITTQALTIALLAGVLPAMLWLWFWIREDKARPEPRHLILLSFVTGMVVVLFVLPAEQYVFPLFSGTALIVVWAAIEELFKYGGAWLAILRNKACDEPIDAVIYMITVALGFSALENTLFLIDPLIGGDVVGSVLTGNFRFLGATLLHTLSSAIIGVAIALSFYKRAARRTLYQIIGIILAIALHAAFNFFILTTNGEWLLTVFFFVWIGVIALILVFEKIKRIKNPRLPTIRN